ncbi:MAG TPA: PhzF family phenazine biosynthesis protein [Vicinamibacteria bacterium]|jgi:trans-2,3-dihydro-3-hydroxyanthranilate isomerase
MSALRQVRFIQADVFTDRPFAGNPLAIVPDGSSLTTDEMQAIAREMNLSETTFVLPADDAAAAFRLRIFTPTSELPLAGHPVVGTCFILAQRGRVKLNEGTNRIFQECGAGMLPVDIHVREGNVARVYMTQAKPQFLKSTTSRALLAAAVGLDEDRLLPDGLPAQVVSTGVPQLMVPAQGLKDLEEIEVDQAALRTVFETLDTQFFMIFTRQTVLPNSTVHARMFAPTLGIPEDPASGSASGALGAYLVRHGVMEAHATTHLIVEQGYEMGRPSTIYVEVDKGPDGGPGDVRVGGQAVEVAEGILKF